MDTEPAPALTNPDIAPDEAGLREALGPAFGAYCAVQAVFAAWGLSHEWRYYRDSRAWLCKVSRKRQTLVWMAARHHCLQASVHLAARHVPALLDLPLADSTRSSIDATPGGSRLRSCVFMMDGPEMAPDFPAVLAFKMSAR